MHKDTIFADTMRNYYATQNIQTKTEGEHMSPAAVWYISMFTVDSCIWIR